MTSKPCQVSLIFCENAFSCSISCNGCLLYSKICFYLVLFNFSVHSKPQKGMYFFFSMTCHVLANSLLSLEYSFLFNSKWLSIFWNYWLLSSFIRSSGSVRMHISYISFIHCWIPISHPFSVESMFTHIPYTPFTRNDMLV